MSDSNEPNSNYYGKITQWLADHWVGDQSCSICGHTQWIIETPVQMASFNTGTAVPGASSRTMPLIPVVCNNCSNTFFLNALFIGAIPEATATVSNSGTTQ